MNTTEKIKKLLEKADSARELGELKEAEIFAAHANRLMITNQITLSDIENINESGKFTNHNDPVVDSNWDIYLYKNKSEGTWEGNLLYTICNFNFCSALFRGNTKATIIGTPSNIEVCKFMFEVLKEKFRKAANETYSNKVIELREKNKYVADSRHEAKLLFLSDFPEKRGEVYDDDFMPESYEEKLVDKYQSYLVKNLKILGLSDRGVFVRSFLLGANNGLWTKLETERKLFMADLESDTPEIREELNKDGEFGLVKSSKAIVNLIKDIEVQNTHKIKVYMSMKFGKINDATGESAGDYVASSQGFNYGKTVSVNKGVGYSANSTKMLK